MQLWLKEGIDEGLCNIILCANQKYYHDRRIGKYTIERIGEVIDEPCIRIEVLSRNEVIISKVNNGLKDVISFESGPRRFDIPCEDIDLLSEDKFYSEFRTLLNL